jgi:hypothetical protein
MQAKPAIVAGLVKCKRVSRPRPSHENPTKRAQRGRELRRLRLDADRRVPDREDGDVVVGQALGHDVHHIVAARAAAVGTQLRRQVQGGLAGQVGRIGRGAQAHGAAAHAAGLRPLAAGPHVLTAAGSASSPEAARWHAAGRPARGQGAL